jgi:hypothetical protein
MRGSYILGGSEMSHAEPGDLALRSAGTNDRSCMPVSGLAAPWLAGR